MTDATRDATGPRSLHGFDDGATRAVALAADEARELGHDRVGTEHLLLGLLTNGSEASRTLTDAGVTLAAARAKVSEAVGTSGERRVTDGGAMPRSPRAERALGRASRFAHADGSDVITSEHVLHGVLDVEGTAGQVVRGLGVDVDAIRDALAAPEPVAAAAPPPEPPAEPARPVATVRCPACDEVLDGQLAFRVIDATDDAGAHRDAVVFSCGACGRVLGVSPA